MKIDLLDGYLVDQNKPGSFILKKRYMGKRNGEEVECEKVVSYHSSFEEAAQRFLSLNQYDKNDARLISLSEYMDAVKMANTKAVGAIRESRMERFYIDVPQGNGKKAEHSIMDLIPVGRDNAISRKLLAELCVNNGLIDESSSPSGRDRAMRKLIEKARADYTILNLSDGQGYYRVSRDDLQDLQRYIRQEEKRGKSTFRNLSMAKKLYEDFKTGRL